MKKFYAPDLSDKRIEYACKALEKSGYQKCENENKCDFVVLGVNPNKNEISYPVPVFAGNINADNIFDYTKEECFALENAYLTAESALALAVSESAESLINAKCLIAGYGRIGNALHKYLSAFTSDITVCARSAHSKSLAYSKNAKVIDFEDLKTQSDFDFIFNTVPHPVFNEKELSSLKKDALLIDLASFPGGVDKHVARAYGIRLIAARGLPAKFSPKTAGEIVADTIDKMIKAKFYKEVSM